MLEIQKIGKLRRALGLTQKELANISGVSQSLIAKIESGNIDPAYSKVTQILGALEDLTKKEKKCAKDILSSSVIAVSPTDSLFDAISLMQSKNLSQLPVFQSGRSVGSLLDSTIVSIISKHQEKNLKSMSVGEVMKESFPAVPVNSPVDAIADLLRHYRAVLVETNGKIIGIITKADLFKAI